MDHVLYTAMLLAILILVASVVSVELGISVAVVEILLGVFAGNILHLHTAGWLDFLAGFGSIVLTFLAGAEVDPDLMRSKLKESSVIGGLSFAVPFAAVLVVAHLALGWDLRASEIAACAMSSTSLAVVYSVLIETGLSHTDLLAFLASKAHGHAVLPAFLLGFALAKTFERHRLEQQRFRVVAFAFLTPFFFLKGGMSMSLPAVWANLGLVGVLFATKLVAKFAGTYPPARRFAPGHAMFLTLLLSTELTFGTISALYGLQAGIITPAQFSALIAVVILTAVVPTVVAQRFFQPIVTGAEHPGAPDGLPDAGFDEEGPVVD